MVMAIVTVSLTEGSKRLHNLPKVAQLESGHIRSGTQIYLTLKLTLAPVYHVSVPSHSSGFGVPQGTHTSYSSLEAALLGLDREKP